MKKQKKAACNQPSQPDHNPGHQSDAGDRSDQTRQTRTRPAAQADEVGWPLPSSAAGGVDGTSEHPPISDAVAADITSIVESACQTVRLTEQQKCELRQCFRILLTPESSPLCKGRALLNIIEHKLMPSWPDVVENNLPLFKLSLSGVRKLVRLARENRDQNGRSPSFAGGDDRVSAPSTMEELPASSAPAANLKDGSLDLAQAAVAEEKQAPVIAEPKVAGVAVSPVVEKSQGPTPLPIGPAQPDTTGPSLALAEMIEQPPPVDTTPPVAMQESELTGCVAQTPAHVAEGDEPPAPRSAERLPYLESVIGKGFMFVFEVGAALEEIRDQELFRPQFKTFAAYFRHKWGWTRARCCQLIGAAKVRRTLSTFVDTAHLSEPLCRVLSKLPDGDQVAAWKDALSAAPNREMKFLHLKQAVAKICPPPPAQPLVFGEAEPPTESNVEPEVVAPDQTRLAAPSGEPVTSSQTEPAPGPAPAPDGSPEFNFDLEWQPIEASLHKLFRRCPPDKLRGYWAKLTAFVEQHPDIVPAEERNRVG